MEYDNLMELFQKRTSVRSYSEKDVTGEEIKKLIEAARWAPTSCNRQSWKVIVVRKGTSTYEMMGNANFGGLGFANQVPVLLLIVVDLRCYEMPREMNFPINDGSIIASYIMLAAVSFGLDTCWISWQASLKRKKRIFSELGLEPYFFPICVLALGYRKGLVNITPREDTDYFIFGKP